MATSVAVETASIIASKFSNTTITTSSIGKFVVVPTIALAVTTAILKPTMALTATPYHHRQQPTHAQAQLAVATGCGGGGATTTALNAAATTTTTSATLTSNFTNKQPKHVPNRIQQLHVIVLIHGWLGTPLEMTSIQEALETEIKKAGQRVNDDDGDNNSILHDDVDDDSSSDISMSSTTPPQQRRRTIPDDTMVVVHSVECNNGKTTDGVIAGGERVAREVNTYIQHLLLNSQEEEEEKEPENKKKNKNKKKKKQVSGPSTIFLSFIGNSLGGLYAREALASIDWDLLDNNDNVSIKPGIFCTTATPHLGKRGQTYVRLPRLAEQGIGFALQPTGQDLFGLNKVIENLATQRKYLTPLQRFQKRIAYANAYGTDLQVPTATAAFLADTESKHYTQESKPPFLLTVTTPQDNETLESIIKASSSSSEAEQDAAEEHHGASSPSATASASGSGEQQHIPASTLARALDALGWTKVFCDVRDKLVSVPIPFNQEENSSEFKAKDEWTSHELKTTVASRIVHDKKWPIPFGHTMLIANSKSEFYAKLNKGGKPFVQQLASDFLDDILECDNEKEE